MEERWEQHIHKGFKCVEVPSHNESGKVITHCLGIVKYNEGTLIEKNNNSININEKHVQHIVVKDTKRPAARKPAGHVQRELMLLFHTSCCFQERERNGKKEFNNNSHS